MLSCRERNERPAHDWCRPGGLADDTDRVRRPVSDANLDADSAAGMHALAMAPTVRVSHATWARAAAIAAASGASIGDVIDRALDAYEQAEFWDKTREALTKHPEAGESDPLWERAAADGLTDA